MTWIHITQPLISDRLLVNLAQSSYMWRMFMIGNFYVGHTPTTWLGLFPLLDVWGLQWTNSWYFPLLSIHCSTKFRVHSPTGLCKILSIMKAKRSNSLRFGITVCTWKQGPTVNLQRSRHDDQDHRVLPVMSELMWSKKKRPKSTMILGLAFAAMLTSTGGITIPELCTSLHHARCCKVFKFPNHIDVPTQTFAA